MAEYLSKVSVQTSVAKKRSYDLSCQHVTTQTFMRPRVAYAKEFFPSEGGTSIKLNLKTYARLAAMLKPTLGSIQIRNRVFFTPFRQVWPVFDEMLEQVPVAVSSGGSQIIPGVPYFVIKDWADLIFDPSFGLAIQAPPTVTNPDYINSNGDAYVLTADGRQFQNIMFALGYQLPTNFLGYVDSSKPYSFLPILALAKTFCDWYFPAQYAHTGEFIIVDGICQRNYQYQVTARDLWNTVRVLMYVFYDNDYYTSQWDTPVSPAPGVFGNVFISDITNNAVDLSLQSTAQVVTNNPSLVGSPSSSVFLPNNGTPFVGGNSSNASTVPSGVFTQFVDTALKKVTNAVMRHKLVGARVIDRMLVDYGVVTSYEQNKRAYYLGSQVFPVQISDVMSNSDTRLTSTFKGEALGEYAGKGIAYDGDGNFEFDTKEFGMLFVINSVVPDVGIVNNVDRQCLHISRLDFFNPNYDGLGVMAVSYSEVYGLSNGSFDNVFGFLPQYSDYKCGFDRLTGLYAFPSQRGGLDSWLTLRSLVPYMAQHSGATAHTIDFMRGSDAYQFCRLFYGYKNEEFDCIYLVHRINLKASMCCKPMYDTYEFDEDEGNKIMMEANGARLN